MIHLFDAYLKDGNIRKACDSLERLVDIDSTITAIRSG